MARVEEWSWQDEFRRQSDADDGSALWREVRKVLREARAKRREARTARRKIENALAQRRLRGA